MQNFELIIDTSRKGARLSLFHEECSFERFDLNAKSESLTNLLESLEKEAGISLDAIDKVLVLTGPGSFTGLRTGIAFSEGLCFSGKRKLYGISSLQAFSLFSAKKEKIVLFRARTDFWYLRLDGIENSAYNQTESFLPTAEVLNILKSISFEEAVVDSFVLENASLKNAISEKHSLILLDDNTSLKTFRTCFSFLKPVLTLEANYIQPSYAEQGH